MDPKRYRLDIRLVGAKQPLDCGEATFTARELGQVLIVAIPDVLIGDRNAMDNTLDALAEASKGSGQYLLMVPASQPLEVYAIEVPPEIGGALH